MAAIWSLQTYISIHNTIHLFFANAPMLGKVSIVILPLIANGKSLMV